MKRFEKLVLSHIRTIIPPDLDKHQFSYRANRSIADATDLTQLEEPYSYVRMLLVEFSLRFNTVIPHKLVSKLDNLGLGSSLCSWVMDFLTD
uniref:Reverse transcriptase domain-containing protein n=1 Tax=Anguilla anguilla TaxID=7936 RepID=A0A0E9S4V9_ANGAN